MTYLPPVVARLSFDLGDLGVKIDEAKEKIRSLGRESVTINERIRTTGGNSFRQQLSDLEKIAREADRINRGEKATMSIKLADGTRTWEQLIALDREMARLNGKTARMHVKVDKSDLQETESVLGKLKSLFTGGHKFNLPFVNFTANPLGLAAIGAGITALLPELAALVSGFTAAGAGAAAFYVLAHPAISNLTADVQGLSAANQKLGVAKNAYQLDPSKVNYKALIKAQDEYNATLKKMGQDAGPAAEGLMKLHNQYVKITEHFKPEVFKVIGGGVKLLSDLLPRAVPFANTFADSTSKWLKNLDKSANSPAFKKFLDQFHQLEGPALQAITAGIGNVAGSIGRLLTVMSGKDVAHGLNIAFSIISGTIGGLTAVIRTLMRVWDGLSQSAVQVGHEVKAAFHGAEAWFSGLWNGAKTAASKVVSFFSGIGHTIASNFDSVRHDIAAKFDGVKADIMAKFAGAGNWLKSAAHDIANAFDHARHDIAAWFDGTKAAIVAKFAGAGAWLLSVGENIVQGLINGLKNKIPGLTGVVNTITGLVKGIGHALGVKSPSTLFDYYGRMIALGLAQGMEAGAGRVGQAAAHLVGMVNGPAAFAAGHVPAGANGDGIIHVHVHIDGREVTNAVAQRSVQTQRRTGTNQLTKRTR